MQKNRRGQTNQYTVAQTSAGVFFWSLVTLLSFYSAVFMAQDIFPEWRLSQTAQIWIAGLAVFTIVLYEAVILRFMRIRVFLALLVPAVYADVCFRYAESVRIDLEDGACALATQFLEKFNRHIGTFYAIWIGKTEFIGLALAFWTLVILLGLLILALLFRKRALLLLLPTAVFAAELTIGFVPQQKGMLLFFTALLFMQADGGANGRIWIRCRDGGQAGRVSETLFSLGKKKFRHRDNGQDSRETSVFFSLGKKKTRHSNEGQAGRTPETLFSLGKKKSGRKKDSMESGKERPYTDSCPFCQTAEVPENNKRYALLHARADGRRAVRWYVCWLPPVCLAGALVLMLSVSSRLSEAAAPSLMNQAPKVIEFQKKTERNVAEIAGRFMAPKRESVTNQAPHYTGKEMLKVTASQEPFEDVLLKGFCGTDYRNGSWVCDNGKFKQACARAGYDLKEAELELLQTPYDMFEQGGGYTSASVYISSAASAVLPLDRGDLTYTIDYTGARGKQAYLPYAADYAQSRGRERLAGDVTAQRAWNQNTFTFRAWNTTMGNNAIMWKSDAPDSGVFEWYDKFARNRYLDICESVPAITDYINKVTGINDFYAFEYYLDEAARYAEPYQRNQARLNLALMVSTYLKFYQNYSTDLRPLPQGEDPVSYFLMKSRQGYCVHFASAAVQLFRQLGIPARYASGYAVRVDDFTKKGDSYVASVKDEAAHAWAEIYLDGFGWAPIDVTPGMEQRRDQMNVWNEKTNGSGNQNNQKDKDPQNTGTDEEETQTDEKETHTDEKENKKQQEGAAGVHRNKWMSRIFLYLLAALMCWLLWQSARFYDTAAKRDIRHGTYSRAVRRINRRIYRRLYLRGKIPRKYLSDICYEQLLKDCFKKVSAEDWTHFMQAVRAAVYARDEISKDEAEFCCQVYGTLKRPQRKNSDNG